MLLFHFILGFSQEDWSCKKPSKKAQKLYEKAQQYSFKGNEAYGLLIESVKEDEAFVEALSILAYLNSKKDQSVPQNKNRTLSYYEKTRLACPAFRNYEATLWLAKYHYKARTYEIAQQLLIEYINNVDKKRKNELEEATDLKKRIDQYFSIFKNPVPFNPIKVEGASSSEDEFLPMLSPDNQYLFFTRRSEVDTKSAIGKQEKEFFVQSRKKYDGSYSGGIPMPTPFNQGSYQGGSSISVDNKLLFITIVDQIPHPQTKSLFSNGDIYYSEFKSGQWGELKSIGAHINGQYTWEGQPSISSDNLTLYFASARGVDNYGGMDLYKTERQKDGSWGPAINLGPKINTEGNEKSPFMHSDSYTLYFSSDGHPTVGGQDIFFAKMNEFGQFNSPTNIGVPINTPNDEHGFMVSTDGKYGYFSSNLGMKGLDIYYFEIPEYARPKDVVFVKGTVASKDPDAAKGMSIELKNMSTNKVTQGVVDEEKGEYVAVITATEKEDVMMMAKKNGYAFTSQYINSTKDVVGKPMRVEPMSFNPIELGETYQINNINFETNSSDLSIQVVHILDEFIEFLTENPSVKVAIYGHTDNIGDAIANLVLSKERSQSVKNYLILEGIGANRLESDGFGANKPIASNKTELGRAKNRRTEFVILSK
tara:strand:+ start:3040 stop:4989 length:1950 start_codon:yes stop_codon:yes gene_type:complete